MKLIVGEAETGESPVGAAAGGLGAWLSTSTCVTESSPGFVATSIACARIW